MDTGLAVAAPRTLDGKAVTGWAVGTGNPGTADDVTANRSGKGAGTPGTR